MTLSDARGVVAELARAVTSSSHDARTSDRQMLEAYDSRTWLLLDEAARTFSYAAAAAVTGRERWLEADLAEPTGVVAAITSFHTDGHIRQRATRALADRGGTLPARALALRLLDHVPQVRAEAHGALLPTLGLSDAGAVLGVLLAGRGRQDAPSATSAVRDVLLRRSSVEDLVEALVQSDDRLVRRWAFSQAHDQQVLTAERLLDVVRSDPDQQLRATAVEWLLPVASTEQQRELVTARSVEARLAAVTYLPDDVLVDSDLMPLLLDRAARVREQARWRAHRRGIATATYYRDRMGDAKTGSHALAASLDGLAATGSTDDLRVFIDHLGHPGAAVRTAALTGLSLHGQAGLVLDALETALLDPSPRVSATAARALVRLKAPPSRAEAAWESPQSWTRRAAWRTSRGGGSWDRVEADLRAAADSDPQVAALGRSGVQNWLSTSAATTWARLSDEQQQRIQTLLASRSVGDASTLAVAFHARIQLQPAG